MSRIILFAALRSGMGNVRTNNEDAYYFNGSYAELKDMDREANLSDSFQNDMALFAICDGMGGYENGEVASFTAVSRMEKLWKALQIADFPSAVNQWVDETNTEIIETVSYGGCTLALLYFCSGKVFTAHIGDSRIYRFCGGKLSRVTKDHSKLQVLLDAGIITEAEIESSPYKHVITRALGMHEDESGKCVPAIHGPVLAENQDWYIICSDGVTDMVSDQQLESILLQAETAADCAEAIYQAAINAGGKDNASVIVLKINEDGQKADIDDEAVEGCRLAMIDEEEDSYESTWIPE